MNETMENSGASRGNPEDTIKILIATDNHLGYQECDPIIGDDSFVAFEEILDLAVKNKVISLVCPFINPSIYYSRLI